MINTIVTRVSLDSFRERSADKKVILLYPWTNYRNLFLSHFLASDDSGLLYYRVPEGVQQIADWMKDLTAEFDEVVNGFGSNLRKALKSPSPKKLGEALAKDLNEQLGERVTLFIDELDRIPFDDDFNKFIDALVSTMNDNRQITFSSRLLTYQPWYNMVADGTALVLGTEYRKNDMMFTVEDEIKPQLEVYGFGRGHALVNGQEITNWDGALPRNLFFYFMDNELVTRDDIFATFWPNLSVKEATNVFHVTKRKISERISSKLPGNEDVELTNYLSGFYLPSERIMRHFDVSDFQEAVEHGMKSSDEREKETLYRRAADLYKAPFLEGVDLDWVAARRQHLAELHAIALTGLARIYRDRGDLDPALGLLIRALKESPTREDLHREIMNLYMEMDRPEDARRQYQHLETLLQEQYEIAPSEETRQLYEQIEG
jgi:DNA-binding SARP family transcriptional activator